MSKKKNSMNSKKAKATEVTNIFNITIEGSGRPVFDDFMDHGYVDDELLDDYDHDCDGDCESCEYYDDEDLDDYFDEDDVPAIVRFARMREANSVLHRSFNPDPGKFDYHDENPGNDNLAQEVSRLSNISNITAFIVLEADNTVSMLEDCYEDFYDHFSRIDYISVLSGIKKDQVLEVLTVVGVIHKMIQDTIAEADGTADDEVGDEPF